MLTKKERERILRDYPETISKEQFYKLCQISKNRARELLIRGVVPCQITKRATHKYVIATLDVIAYLESLPRIRRKRGSAATMPRQTRSVTLTQVPPALGRSAPGALRRNAGALPGCDGSPADQRRHRLCRHHHHQVVQ